LFVSGTAAVKNMKAMIEYHKEHPNEKINEESIPLPFKPTLNGLCITDFGNDGAIFLTIPQLPPRRADYTIYGRVATLAKLAFEKYFLMKIETGDTDPYYEKYMLVSLLGHFDLHLFVENLLLQH
jgi:sulfide:quinone oxidoreductase